MYKIIIHIVLLTAVVDHVSWAKENENQAYAMPDSDQEVLLKSALYKKELDYAQFLLASEPSLQQPQIISVEKRLAKLCERMKKDRRQYKSESEFISHVFYHVKSYYLLRYKENTEFSEVFISNTYNCVTGTALFALVFNTLGIRYQILETYSHVCIKVLGDSSQVLLETTLKDGVYTNGKQIYERLKKMQSDKKEQVLEVLNSSYKPMDLSYYCSKIDLTQLIGILYFNKAAQQLAEKKYGFSIYYARIANTLYPSARTQGFLVYSIHSLLKDSTVDYKTKAEYYKKYKHLIDQSLTVLK